MAAHQNVSSQPRLRSCDCAAATAQSRHGDVGVGVVEGEGEGAHQEVLTGDIWTQWLDLVI
jgi:hypothetical protein